LTILGGGGGGDGCDGSDSDSDFNDGKSYSDSEVGRCRLTL